MATQMNQIGRAFTLPSGRLPAGGQNFLLDSVGGTPRELHDDELFQFVLVPGLKAYGSDFYGNRLPH